MCCVREHAACDGKLARTMCESIRRATEAGVCCVCELGMEAGVCDVCEHAACDGKLVCAMCEGIRRALCYGKLACTM